MTYAPIALFTYNRFEHTQATVEALQKNPEAANSEIIIFSDGPKSELDSPAIHKIRTYLKNLKGFKSLQIVERQKNLGLARSIISGVSEILAQHSRIIVLEDDLLVSPYFLKYMNESLELYENEEKVASIHAYVFPVNREIPETFFLKGAECWGWATWRRGWKFFEADGRILLKRMKSKSLQRSFDRGGTYPYTQMLRDQVEGRVNSWAIRWRASTFLEDKLTLHPARSLVKNIGFDGSGTHSDISIRYDASLSSSAIRVEAIPLEESDEAKKAFEDYFRGLNLYQVESSGFKSKVKRFILRFKQN